MSTVASTSHNVLELVVVGEVVGVGAAVPGLGGARLEELVRGVGEEAAGVEVGSGAGRGHAGHQAGAGAERGGILGAPRIM